MKYIAAFLVLISFLACKSNTEKETVEETTQEEVVEEIATDGINTRVPDEEDGGEMLLGKINCKGLQEEPFNEWFTENYNAHVLDSTLIDSLKPLLKDVKITTFMGTWCEDSQREVPALFKILDEVEYEDDAIGLVAVNHEKTTPQEFEKDLNIEYVPTIIIYNKDGEEMNRIVEYPQQTLEKDMLTILKGQPYKHAYEE